MQSGTANKATSAGDSPGWVWLVVAIFVGVGCFFALPALTEFDDAIDSRYWPRVTGRVLESESFANVAGGQEESAVKYSYVVDDKEYRNTRVTFGNTRRSAASVIKEYPLGKEVSVSYKADDPSTAVLEPGYGGLVFNLVVGFVAIAVGLFILARSSFETQRTKGGRADRPPSRL